jgi:hypothetical protein
MHRKMPPGMFHCVFTLENSYFTGWHEYNFCSMSETERWRRFDKDGSNFATNIEHPSVYEIIDQMLYYLGLDDTISMLFTIVFCATAAHGYLELAQQLVRKICLHWW